MNGITFSLTYGKNMKRFEEQILDTSIMPFGKHEGEQISDLPVGYAKWCLKNLDLDGWLEEELEYVVNEDANFGRPYD